MLPDVDDRMTADATCIVRLWVERADPVLRGRIESTLDGTSVTARGLDELLATIRAELHGIERALVRQLDGSE
jgi:hypothetical protein